MTSPDALTAVVVDWNLPDSTIRCVEALIADGVPASRIVVVENEPSAENWSSITRGLPGCVLVRVGANVGFARANNIGARILPAQAYLLVNNDAFVHRAGSVTALLNAVDRGRIGIAVPRLLNTDLTLQPTVAPFTTPVPALVRASGLSRLVPDRWQPSLSTHWSHSHSREVEAAIGAVMLVDGQVWAHLGGLRESSFMYAEDLDLCWRAREEGWKTWFTGESEFVHLGGASADRRWDARERWERIGRAEGAMLREHLPPAKAAVTIGLMRLGLAVRVVLFRLLGRTHAAAGSRGFMAGLGHAPSAHQSGEPAPAPAVEVVQPRTNPRVAGS